MDRKLYSYVLRYDDGAAPNPYWGTCTLTICKPDIRRTASEGDWVIGTGSKNTHLKDGNTYDFSDSIVYAMKVTRKLSLADYNQYCKRHLSKKIPKWFNKNFHLRMGDCIFDFANRDSPISRISVHNTPGMNDHAKRELFETDLRGKFSLLSKHFYYFGEDPKPIPIELLAIIKRGQKHLVNRNLVTIEKFEKWISKFKKNKIYAEPQLKFQFDLSSTPAEIAKCAQRHLED